MKKQLNFLFVSQKCFNELYLTLNHFKEIVLIWNILNKKHVCGKPCIFTIVQRTFVSMMENNTSSHPATNETIKELNIQELAKSYVMYKIGKFNISILIQFI